MHHQHEYLIYPATPGPFISREEKEQELLCDYILVQKHTDIVASAANVSCWRNRIVMSLT